MPPLLIEIERNRLVVRKNDLILKEVETQPSNVRPIVKWAGGKQWLASAAQLLKPQGWKGRYFEPFLGGGAFFFALAPSKATLSDSNKELIETYKTIRDEPEEVIKLLKTYPYDKSFYYSMRGKEPQTSIEAAARFVFLNKTCWNGLYRVNKEGKFNTPFGRYTNPSICNSERIKTAANFLKEANLINDDFSKILLNTKPGDFVYIDPPYVTGHNNNGFLMYNAKLFAWADQEKLAICLKHLSQVGVYVLVSNAEHHEVVKLYQGFNYYQVTRLSLIARNKQARGVVKEALLSNYPILGCKPEEV